MSNSHGPFDYWLEDEISPAVGECIMQFTRLSYADKAGLKTTL
jgi:hypothetical protein